MIKSLVAAVALTIGRADNSVAQEPAHRHHQHHRHHIQPGASAYFQPGASAYVPPGPSAERPDIYWSPAGGNPIDHREGEGPRGPRRHRSIGRSGRRRRVAGYACRTPERARLRRWQLSRVVGRVSQEPSLITPSGAVESLRTQKPGDAMPASGAL
jgi:hypothetical protein